MARALTNQDKEGARVARTFCWWCKARCRVLAYIKNDHLLGCEEDAEYPIKGLPSTTACLRRQAAREYMYHPDRVNYPLKRVGEKGSGKWQQIPWDQALDELAEKLSVLRDKYGPETLANSSGTGRTTDEYRSRFFNLFGSPNNVGQSQICHGPRAVTAKMVMGWWPYIYISPETRCVILLGREPSKSWFTVWKVVREVKQRGAKIITFDPRREDSAQISDIHIQLRPGTDGIVLMAMINVIIQEELYDKEFVSKWCHGFEELKQRVAEYSVERAAEVSWVPAETIREAARTYATSRPANIVEGMGTEHLQNTELFHARYILSAICGNVDVEGGEYISGPHPKVISEHEIEFTEALSPEQRRKQIGYDRFRLYTWKGYEMIQENMVRHWTKKSAGCADLECKAHAPMVYRAMLSNDPYPVRAMITLSSNPMVTQANTKLVYQALKSLDLYVVVDFWKTPSADLADYVLPSACWLERPYLWTSHNNGNSVITGEQALPKSIDGEYDHRHDYDFWRGLGIRLGQAEHWPWEKLDESYDYRLAPMGTTFKDLMARGGMEIPGKEYRKYEKTGFATTTGRVELKSTILERLGYDPLPSYREPTESPYSQPELAKEYPYILITGGRHLWYYHSEHRQIQSLRKRHPDPLMQIHPETAAKLGIKDGDWAYVETKRGRCKQKCQVTDGIDPRVIHAQHGWWFPEDRADEPSLHGVWKSNINICTDDDPDICNPQIGVWPLRTGLCKVYRAED